MVLCTLGKHFNTDLTLSYRAQITVFHKMSMVTMEHFGKCCSLVGRILHFADMYLDPNPLRCPEALGGKGF